ncbi:MAG TPA: tetratricopeptide repeat protein [Anaerolineae bacterium]|nr:tetratricopeptide repeat protein [Anaerolineae bacterium]
MHNLIPHFIYEQYQAGHLHGHFPATALFLDISGFTPMTQALMAHGKEGAEVLVNIINQIFDPIIHAIYEQGGFITGFAGDAFTAVFPYHKQTRPLAICITALYIRQTFKQQGHYQTQFGDFRLQVKQGLSAGTVEWGIIGFAERKTYFFRGLAIDGCAYAEHQAEKGDIIIDAHLQALLPPTTITTTPLNSTYAQLIKLSATTNFPSQTISPPTIPLSIASQFFAPSLWQKTQQGEFRDVVTLFVSFESTLELDTINNFITQAMLLVNRYDGLFVETDFGDKGGLFVVHFGAPTTHENDIQRALQFILAMKTDNDFPLKWRAGITFGTVYAGYVGIPLRDKYACMGSIVNLAARLMMHASWGEVLVSKTIALHPSFDFISLGKLPYKGFSQPIPTYLLQGKSLVQQVFRHKMVGREREFNALATFAQPLFIEQQARVAIIYGQAGIGKSHLTYSWRQSLGTNVRWLNGQCDSILQEAFSPFVYFLKGYFGQLVNATESENKTNFDHRLNDLLSSLAPLPHSQRQHDELVRTRSFLGALIDLYWPDSLYSQLDAQGRYQNMLIAISMLLQAESQRQPIMVEIEDAHWLDEASHELLTTLTRQIQNFPILIIITSRYTDDGSQPTFNIDDKIPTLTIDLSPISTIALQTLAQDILGAPIAPPLQTILLEKADANPFFAQQILYYLQENNLLQTKQINGQPLITLINNNFELPTTINALLIARLDRLTQQVKEVVQTASVLGQEFDTRLLTRILERDLTQELALAEREQIWIMLDMLQYIFKHALLREAAYEMQLRGRLRHLHHFAAQMIEQLYAHQLPNHYDKLAYHYETAYHLGQHDIRPIVQFYLQSAGEKAWENFENNHAITYFSKALTLTPENDIQKQYDLYLWRAKVYDRLGNRETQEADLTQLAHLATHLSVTEQNEVVLLQAELACLTGNYEQAIKLAQKAIEQATKTDNLHQIIEGHKTWSLAAWRTSKYSQAKEQYEKGLQLAEQINDLKQVTFFLCQLGWSAWQKEDYRKSHSYFKRALTVCYQTNDPTSLADCFDGFAAVYTMQEKQAGAIIYYEKTLDLFRKIGHLTQQGIALYNLSWLHMQKGDYEKAATLIDESLTISIETEAQFLEGLNLKAIGLLALYHNDYDQANSYLKKALSILKQIGHRRGESHCLNQLGVVALQQKNTSLAETYYEQALAIHQDMGEQIYINADLSGLAKVKLAQGNLNSAHTHCQQLLENLIENPNSHKLPNSMQTFRFTWEALSELGQTASADKILTTARQIMTKYLETNPDPADQAMYLAQPDHQFLWQRWQQRISNP